MKSIYDIVNEINHEKEIVLKYRTYQPTILILTKDKYEELLTCCQRTQTSAVNPETGEGIIGISEFQGLRIAILNKSLRESGEIYIV